MPTHKKGQDRDKYYQLAKDQGYRSRAAFKLIQINKRYDFLSKAKVAIDLCAAPGGWCQVAAKFMPGGSIVLGVDLLPIRPIRGVKTFVGDITTASTRKAIVAELEGHKADVVLCDGAPNIGAAYNKDAFVQNELVLAALKTATEHLNKGGVFCTKVYRSVDYNAVVWTLQQLFMEVQTMKPNSSRSQSSEIFLVCMGYLAPQKIDTKLFDINYVFKEVQDPSLKKPDVLHKKADAHNRRHRSGYDDAQGMLLHPTCSVEEFMASHEPVRLLSDVHEIVYRAETDAEYEEYLTDEVRGIMKDLQVIGKGEFKKLLKWRTGVKDALKVDNEPVSGAGADGDGKVVVEVEESEDVKIAREISEMREKDSLVRKKEDKKSRKELRKLREKGRLGMLDSAFEVSGDGELFSLPPRITSKQLSLLGDISLSDPVLGEIVAGGADGDEGDADGAMAGTGAKGKKNMIVLKGEADDLEDELEGDYERFMNRREMKKLYVVGADGVKAKAGADDTETFTSRKRRRGEAPLSMLEGRAREDEELIGDDEEEEGWEDRQGDVDSELEAEEVVGGRGKKRRGERGGEYAKEMERYLQHLAKGDKEGENDDDDDDDSSDGEGARPMKTISAPPASVTASKWFANPLFAAPIVPAGAKAEASDDDSEDGQSEGEKEVGWDGMPRTEKEKRKEKRKKERERRERKQEKASGGSKKKKTGMDGEDGGDGMGGDGLIGPADKGSFEIVPRESQSAPMLLPRHDTRTYDSDEEEYDAHDKLTTLALGTFMFTGGRKKNIVDASYNRYAYNDPSALPSWFLDDEMRHNKPLLPVPTALLEGIKNKYNIIGKGTGNKKETKKEREAKMRKKKRAEQTLNKAKRYASQLAENNDLSDREKLKALLKASKKGGNSGDKKGNGKVYVTTKKTKAGSVGNMKGGSKGKLKFVDKRMKKEVRAQKANKRRSKK